MTKIGREASFKLMAMQAMLNDRNRLTILAQNLASHDLLVEVGFTLLDAGREALFLSIVDKCLDGGPLPLR